jgi:hypothetical protein
MFTELYLKTTNPETPIVLVIKDNLRDILLSVVFHTVVYVIAFHLASFIFFGKFLSTAVSIRLTILLLLIMFFGYIGRYYHVQDVYKAYGYNKEKTRAHLDRLYIGWIFIG